MKQKDSNINIEKAYWLTKGYFVVLLLFFNQYLVAQKILEKSLISDATKIVVDLDIIDRVELINSDENDKILVHADTDNDMAPQFILEENEGVVFIRSMQNFLDQNVLEIDKQCNIQPIYTAFRIKVPKNKKVDVSFVKGNFYTENFKGDLYLKVEEGIVKIRRVEGQVHVGINVGNVYVLPFIDTKIDLHSNLGKISANLQLKNEERSKGVLKGVFGENIHKLSVQAILANIQLKASEN